jgi:tetratricopeptide (TPR) repeat protein
MSDKRTGAAKVKIPSGRHLLTEPSQVLPVVCIVGPSALLAWSGYGAWISDDPLPHLSGFALAALVALLASAWTLVRGREPALLPNALLLCAVLCGAVSVATGRATDSIEAQRAWCVAAAGFGLLCAGGSLRPGARSNLGRALPLVSLAFTLPALASQLAGGTRGLAGALGNTGAVSLAALPGAGAGAWLLLRRPGAWRWVGLAACLAFTAHALIAPVLSGLLAFAALFAAFALVPSATTARAPAQAALATRAVPAACALVLALGAWLAPGSAARGERATSAPPPNTSTSTSTSASTGASTSAGASTVANTSPSADRGGFEVRVRLWRTLPAIVAQAPLYGLGPGQFQAAYPPLRDPAELELSTHGRASRDFSEVEHLHNDWLQGFAELGVIGGTAWALLLAAGLWASIAALRGGDPTRAIAGAALLPLLVGALAHAPLSYLPASSAQGFALLGLLLSSPLAHASPTADAATRPRWQVYALRALPLAFGLLALPAMLALLEHGRALTNRGAFAAWVERHPDTDPVAARRRERGYIDAALRANALSAVAHALRARHLAEDPLERELELGEWRAVLAQRPWSAEALFRSGLLHAAAGRDERAREQWERLLEIDRDEPVTLRNLALLEARAGRADLATAHFDRLEARQRLSVDWLRTTAANELLGGRLDSGLAFARRAETWSEAATPERLAAAAQMRARVSADLYSEALGAAAQWLWGREQFAAGNASDAVRNFRQALRESRRVVATGAPALRVELAVALANAGRADEARQELDGIALDAALLKLLPAAIAAQAPALLQP